MNLTLTGADEKTDISELSELSLKSEIAILYSATNKDNRYPRREWIKEALPELTRCAIHICEKSAREQLIKKELDDILFYVQRIQVNGTVSFEELVSICLLYSSYEIITQYNPENEILNYTKFDNHSILIDGSGGRGISPETWSAPDVDKPIGFAGGLGPDNLKEEMVKIKQVSKWGAWVDMESKLRVDDWFSVDKAWEVCRIFNKL